MSNGENKVSLEHSAIFFLSTLIETELIEKTILNTYPTAIVATATTTTTTTTTTTITITTTTTTTTPTSPSSPLSVFLLNFLHFRTQPTTGMR